MQKLPPELFADLDPNTVPLGVDLGDPLKDLRTGDPPTLPGLIHNGVCNSLKFHRMTRADIESLVTTIITEDPQKMAAFLNGAVATLIKDGTAYASDPILQRVAITLSCIAEKILKDNPV
jgi:hypothetical protein